MSYAPDPNRSSRLDDASTVGGRARDSDDEILSEHNNSSHPHPRHPVASGTSAFISSRGEPPASIEPPTGVTLFSIFSDSATPFRANGHQLNSQSTEVMLNPHSEFPEPRSDCNTGHETKETLPHVDPHCTQVKPPGMKIRLKRFISKIPYITSTNNNAPSIGPRQRVVANVAFADALHTENPSPWTKSMFKLYFFLLIAFFNSFANGYDSSLMGGINNMDYYRTYFKIEKTGAETGLIFSVFAIGNICGSFFCGPLSDLWGRRWGMFHGAAILIVGSCIQGLADHGPSRENRDMFILGRFLLGFGIATCQTAGPSYVAEMAHPAWRGLLTGLYNCWYFVGGIAATWITYRTSQIPSELSWRLPSWIQVAPACIIMIGSIFIPETPRWLFSHDRQEEAIRVLTKYIGGGNRRSPIVRLTLREMIDRILIEGSDKRWWDYSEVFNSRAAAWRLVCVAGIAVFGQWSGNGAVTYFMPVLLFHVGVENPQTQLLYNAILNILQLMVSTYGAFFIEKFGRRPTLIIATSLFVVWWAIITALMSFLPLERAKESLDMSVIYGSRAAIAMIYLFACTYAFSYTPLQILYPVECLSYETRAKGMGVYNLVVNIATLYNTYGIPTVIDRIGWKMYWIYVVWNIFQVIFIWAFFVETKGRTLEEINEIFEAKNPKKKSLQRHIVEETDLGLLYHGLMNELQDMEGVISPIVPPDPHAVPPGFEGPSVPTPVSLYPPQPRPL